MAAPKGARPVTRALTIVKAMERVVDENNDPSGFYALTARQRGQLIGILCAIDASTGRPDAKRKRAKKPPNAARARR